jgi:uncharacterized membrane protein (DUF106 family)
MILAIKSFVQKYWTLFLIALIAVLYVIFRRDSETREKMQNLKGELEKKYEEIQRSHVTQTDKLEKIKKINDDEERLKKLADYANGDQE